MIFSEVVEWFRSKLGRPSSNKVAVADTDTASSEKIDATFWHHYDWKPLRFSSLEAMSMSKGNLLLEYKMEINQDNSSTLIFSANDDLIKIGPDGLFFCFNQKLPELFRHEPIMAHMAAYENWVSFAKATDVTCDDLTHIEYYWLVDIYQSTYDLATDTATIYEVHDLKTQQYKDKEKKEEDAWALQQEIISKWRNK